jgi:programmed cell death 6-interacting protein
MVLVEKRGGAASAGSLYAEFQKIIQPALQQAEKDNDFIYHLRVPDASKLPAVEKAVVAKATPLSSPLNSSFTGMLTVLYTSV